MSLKVWLPLDGDLRNLGTSNIEFTNENTSNIVIDTAGKIGKCYKRTAAKTTGRIIANKTINLNNDLSICCWAKVTATVGNTANGLISLHSHEHNTGFGLTVKEISTTDYRICCSTGNGSNRTYSSYYGTTNIKDSWHHLALTYNNTIKQFKLWVDGNLEYTQSYTNASRDETLMLFEWSTTYNEVNYRPACSLNDVRIYDHCLSTAEVHEIAQGLVLHYKLDGNGFGNPNLLANSKLDGSWTYPSSSYSDKYSPITTSIPTASQYTLSFEAKSTVNGDKIRTHYYSPNTTTTCVSNQGVSKSASDGNMDFTLTTNWEKYWVIYSQNETTAVKHIICPRLVSGNGTGTVSVRNVKLEEGNIATPWCPNANDDLYKILGMDNVIIEDNSGYGHNGTIIGDLIINKETKRYLSSTKWNSSAPAESSETGICYIQTSFSLTNPLHLSFTWWAKPENGYNGVSNSAFCTSSNSTRPIDYNTTAFHHRDSGFDICPSDNTGVKRLSFTYIKNEWHHYAITYDGTTAKTYRDGTLQTTVTIGTNKTLASFSQLFIGYSQAGGARRKTLGSYSDFRIYCTPLLDNDIKMLYNLGMKVDNLQNLHTFEYKENTSNLFRSELIMPWAKANRTRIGEIVSHNNTYALNIAPEPFYKNISDSISGALDGMFIQNTSYVFDMWIDTDSVIYNNNNVAGGMTIRYSDNSTDNTFVFTGGNKGYQHKVLITPSNKTVQRLEFYYYTSTDVFYRIDSCICPLSNLKLHKTGIFEGTNFLEETSTKLIKNTLIETNEIIEI